MTKKCICLGFSLWVLTIVAFAQSRQLPPLHRRGAREACTYNPISTSDNRAGGGGFTLTNFSAVIADVKGFLKEEGVEPDWVRLASGAAAAALIQGDLKFLEGSVSSTFPYAPQIKAIAGQIVKRVANKLVVRSGINSIKDLKGKRLAISSFGSSSHSFFLYLLKQNGIGPSEVIFQPVPTMQAWIAGMQAGTLDAVVPSLPGDQEILRTVPGSKVLFDLGDAFPEYAHLNLMTRADTIQQNRPLVKQVVRAWTKTVSWQRNPKNAEEFANLFSEKSKYPLDLSMKGVVDVRGCLGHILTERALTTAQEGQRLAGVTSKLPTYGEIVDMSIQKEVLVELGIKE